MNNVLVDYAQPFNEDATTVLITTLTNTKLAKVLDDVTPDSGTICEVSRDGTENCKVRIDFETHFIMKCFLNRVSPSFISDAKRRREEYEEAKENATLS